MAKSGAGRRMYNPPLQGERTIRASAPGVIMVAALFAFLLATLGGSSRYDMLQISILLPVSCLAAGYGLYRSWDADWSALKVPLILLMAWTGLTLLQVIPLPPGLWQALPGREPMAQIAGLLGDDKWRPLSMVPWRTQHALWALSIPLAALFVFAALRERAVEITVQAAIAFAVASALLGILQVTLPSSDLLYFYAITNRGSPVGLFANENHAAMFSAVMLVVIAATMKIAPRPLAAWHMPALGAAFFTLLVTQFINGSRAGLGLTVVALVASALIALQGSGGGKASLRDGVRGLTKSPEARIAAALFVGSIAIAVVFYFNDRLPALSDMVGQDVTADVRFKAAPILQQMTGIYFPFGSGFGSFETVYYIHEPSDLLSPVYLNQAHDDLLQIIIEGGIFAVAIAVAALIWAGRLLWQLLRQNDVQHRVIAFAGIGMIAIVLMASSVDYPLRVPLFQATAVWLVGMLAVLAKQPSWQGPENARV